MMTADNQKPKIDLKKHQRFKREVPWGLIRKVIIAIIMVGLIYYITNNFNSETDLQNHSIDFDWDPPQN